MTQKNIVLTSSFFALLSTIIGIQPSLAHERKTENFIQTNSYNKTFLSNTCHPYTQTVRLKGQNIGARGRACLNDYGHWTIVSSSVDMRYARATGPLIIVRDDDHDRYKRTHKWKEKEKVSYQKSYARNRRHQDGKKTYVINDQDRDDDNVRIILKW